MKEKNLGNMQMVKRYGRVVITGATGFIGHALVKKFLDLEYEVYAVVREKSSKISIFNEDANLKIIYCNLEHFGELEKKISCVGFDAFFHLAWQGVANEESKEVNIQLENVKYACDAVNAACKLQCIKFIFAASIMEYEVMKLMETEIDAGPRNIYRTAKITAHYMTRIVANELGVDYNAAIISNVYGRGEISDRFVNSTLRKMLKGERVKFTEAKQLYDFIYIDDAIDMLILIAQKGRKNKNYYIGSMEPRILREYIYEMRDCVDENLELGIGESKEYVGVSLNYDEVDIKAGYYDFGFQPQYSFKEGIVYTVEWIKSLEGKSI